MKELQQHDQIEILLRFKTWKHLQLFIYKMLEVHVLFGLLPDQVPHVVVAGVVDPDHLCLVGDGDLHSQQVGVEEMVLKYF